MDNLKLFLIVVFLASSSCKQEEREKESLTIIALGITDSLTSENRGFAPGLFCYIDFLNDSVFVREKETFGSKIMAKSGFVVDIDVSSKVTSILAAFDTIPNGYIYGELTSTIKNMPDTYSGMDFYVEHKKGLSERYFYTRKHKIDSLFQLVMNLKEENELLKFVSTNLTNDELIIPVINMQEFILNPPPPIKTIIKFLPPKVDTIN